MIFDVGAFTHAGTARSTNEDRVLIQDSILKDQCCAIEGTSGCFCFVADGIGGHPCGDVAAQFVLSEVRERHQASFQIDPENRASLALAEDRLREMLADINIALIQRGREVEDCSCMGTTLVGFIANENGEFQTVNAGDSESWLLRDDMLFQIATPQVADTLEKESPITSYFGGTEDHLDLDFSSNLASIQAGDVFLLCSDGLFKALPQKQVKVILQSNTALSDQIDFLRSKALEAGASDNVSAVVVRVHP